jgi:GMP synthase (glutamine-hydrolysing)
VLGICYGHQLLAYAMGGEVGPNPNGREFGTVEITLQAPARADSLLADMPERFFGNTSHTQSVLRLPEGATCLASSRQEGCHAFAIGPTAWGVQFHPEFDANVVRTYIDQSSHLLTAEGFSPQQLLDEVRETPEASAVLRRFAQLADGTGT